MKKLTVLLLLAIMLSLSVLFQSPLLAHASSSLPLAKFNTVQIAYTSGTPYEQAVDTSPLHNATMIDSGLYTSSPTGLVFSTTNYWSTNNFVGNYSIVNGCGDEDNMGSYSGNGSYYSGFFLCNSGLFAGGWTLIKSQSDNGSPFVRTNGVIFANNQAFNTTSGSTVYPCDYFLDLPRIIGDKAPGSTWVYVTLITDFATTPNAAPNCNAGQGVAFGASSDGANTYPIRTALIAPQISSYGFHPLAVTTNSTIYLTGTDSSACGSGGGQAVYKSTNHGSSWTSSCVAQQVTNLNIGPDSIAVYGTTTVYSVFRYIFYNNSISDSHFFVSRSTDAGRTWSTPIQIDGAPHVTQTLPFILESDGAAAVSANGRLDVAWQDMRNTQTNATRTDIYYVYSFDGVTFSNATRLTPNGPYNWCSQFGNSNNNSCYTGNDFFGLTESWNSGNYTVYLTFSRATNSVGGSYYIFLTTINVADFSISASPATLPIPHGSTKSSTITLTSLNGFSGTVTLSWSILPVVNHGPSPSLSPTSITLTSGGQGTSTLTVKTANNTPRQMYAVTVTASSGSITHTVTVSVTVS